MKRLAIISVLFFASTLHAQSIEAFADSLMKKGNIPEMAFAVIAPDSILTLKVLGYRRADLKNAQTKASLTDYFHLGSNTKAITGFTAAWLVAHHKINWTTRFFDLFPDWQKDSDPAYYNITLASLLSHRARIQPYTSGLEYAELPRFKGNRSDQRRQFARYLLKEQPVKDSTEAYHYSNAGYTVAALMLEKVIGKTWEELVKEVMTNNLGLSIVFGWPNNVSVNQPYGHRMEDNQLKPVPPGTDYNLHLAEPAGDISMTLPDYAKFVQLNLQGIEGGTNLLSAANYNYLHFAFPAYAIGWANYTKAGKLYSEHAGSAGTFFCYTLIDKTDKRAYVIMANSATEGTENAIQTLS